MAKLLYENPNGLSFVVVRGGDRLLVREKMSDSVFDFIARESPEKAGGYSFIFDQGGALVLASGVEGFNSSDRRAWNFTCEDLVFIRPNRWTPSNPMFTSRDVFELRDAEEAVEAMKLINAPQFEVLCSSSPDDLRRCTVGYADELVVPMGESDQGGTIICIPTEQQFGDAVRRLRQKRGAVVKNALPQRASAA